MKWDDVSLVILAAFGCVTLLLTQISEVLSRLPQIIRAWRQVRQELSGGTGSGGLDHSTSATSPGTLAADLSSREGHASGEPEAERDD
ncbi:hypothetical protein D9753_25610 [Streptomyces dangxiongensis]|uniref:Uncharacterized protein n=1 Tax=Streptomyces dangxiongensis TaxID=1442032 RepID=A0A3G2JH15_9ACTN|nr:hypothetical protein [Streptomyces dangxiongensis]AYN41690.1 hypothetical protein D9753_25610 [Streptomyces dangxiongensis]